MPPLTHPKAPPFQHPGRCLGFRKGGGRMAGGGACNAVGARASIDADPTAPGRHASGDPPPVSGSEPVLEPKHCFFRILPPNYGLASPFPAAINQSDPRTSLFVGLIPHAQIYVCRFKDSVNSSPVCTASSHFLIFFLHL